MPEHGSKRPRVGQLRGGLAFWGWVSTGSIRSPQTA
jgi:hypothetical protein